MMPEARTSNHTVLTLNVQLIAGILEIYLMTYDRLFMDYIVSITHVVVRTVKI